MDTELVNKIVRLLKPYRPERIAVFGSYARGEERPDSDLDILISFQDQIGLIKLVQIEQELSAQLHKDVELVTENSIKDPVIKKYIERDLVRIYG